MEKPRRGFITVNNDNKRLVRFNRSRYSLDLHQKHVLVKAWYMSMLACDKPYAKCFDIVVSRLKSLRHTIRLR